MQATKANGQTCPIASARQAMGRPAPVNPSPSLDTILTGIAQDLGYTRQSLPYPTNKLQKCCMLSLIRLLYGVLKDVNTLAIKKQGDIFATLCNHSLSTSSPTPSPQPATEVKHESNT